jgi:DNA-binding transcriptional LysR family regulator
MNADLDLRKLRYFVAVADTLHFGRAAEQLLIAQPVLSRQIRVFEQELGAQLFARDTRGTQLTEIGRQLRADADALLAGADAVRRRVAVAARGTSVFTVGFMPGLTVAGAVRAFQTRHPEVSIEVVRTGWDDQVRVVHDGRVDVSFVRLPVDAEGLELVPLFLDPRVVMLPASHGLATRPDVELADLAEMHLVQDPAAVPEWAAVAKEMRRRTRSEKAASRTVEEKLELVAVGQGIAILPLSTAEFYRRPDVEFRPVRDLPPSQVALAWERTRSSALISDFASAARTSAGEPASAPQRV